MGISQFVFCIPLFHFKDSKVCIKYLTMKPIIIRPILFQLTGDLTSLLEHISKEFDALVKITFPLNHKQLPLNLFDKNRRQWKSNNILLWLRDRNKPDRGNKLLGICDFDGCLRKLKK